jgi:PAS domain S-box-containing protein
MKAGAQDYINKDSMARLVPAVRRELQEAELRKQHKQAQQSLQDREEQYRILLQTIPHGIQENDLQGIITYSNRAHANMLGFSHQQELIGKPIWDFMVDEESTAGFKEYFQHLVNEQPEPQSFYTKNSRLDNKIIDVKVDWNYKYDNQQQLLGFISVITDITKERQSENALKKSEQQYRSLVEYSPDIIYRFSSKHGGIYYSPRVSEILGYSPETLKKDKMLWHNSIHNDDLPAVDAAINMLGNDEKYDLEYRIKDANGKWLWFHDRNFAVHQIDEEVFTDGIVTDISERKAAEIHILNALHEKEALLRELHHRVKNNMQIISSIMSLQSRHLTSDEAKELLDESRQRIRAMAFIHERMYSTGNLSKINFMEYMQYLAEHLTRIYQNPYSHVDIQLAGEPIEISVEQAIPCAMIANELITNAIKHAYPDGHKEHIVELRLERTAENSNRIIVRDRGIGIPDAEIKDEPDSLGILIIKALTKQINGSIKLESDNGTVATLQFSNR